MAQADVLYTARLGLETIERGRDNLIKCPVYRDGALVAPSAGTVTVYNASGTAIVDAASVTVSGSVAEYTITAATVASESFGDGWAVEWALTLASLPVNFRTDAALVRRQLFPSITDADLFRRLPSLDPSGNAPITSSANYQDRLDESWDMIVRRLLAEGVLPWVVTDAAAFREAHITLALSLILRDLAVRTEGSGYYAEEAREYRQEYEKAWRGARYRVDRNDDGIPDDLDRSSTAPTVWMGAGAKWLI